MRFSFRRWGVFSLVGVGGFVLQLGTIALLTRWLGWPPLIATAVGLEIAAFHNFIGHNQFTWKECPPRSGREWIRRYLRYQVAKTTSLAASLAATMIVNATIPLPLEIANTIAVVVCALPNYLLTERLVFRVPLVPLGARKQTEILPCRLQRQHWRIVAQRFPRPHNTA